MVLGVSEQLQHICAFTKKRSPDALAAQSRTGRIDWSHSSECAEKKAFMRQGPAKFITENLPIGFCSSDLSPEHCSSDLSPGPPGVRAPGGVGFGPRVGWGGAHPPGTAPCPRETGPSLCCRRREGLTAAVTVPPSGQQREGQRRAQRHAGHALPFGRDSDCWSRQSRFCRPLAGRAFAQAAPHAFRAGIPSRHPVRWVGSGHGPGARPACPAALPQARWRRLHPPFAMSFGRDSRAPARALVRRPQRGDAGMRRLVVAGFPKIEPSRGGGARLRFAMRRDPAAADSPTIAHVEGDSRDVLAASSWLGLGSSIRLARRERPGSGRWNQAAVRCRVGPAIPDQRNVQRSACLVYNLYRYKCCCYFSFYGNSLTCINRLIPAYAIEPILLERLSVTVTMSYGDDANSCEIVQNLCVREEFIAYQYLYSEGIRVMHENECVCLFRESSRRSL
jgi:hypothetical protein